MSDLTEHCLIKVITQCVPLFEVSGRLGINYVLKNIRGYVTSIIPLMICDQNSIMDLIYGPVLDVSNFVLDPVLSGCDLILGPALNNYNSTFRPMLVTKVSWSN